MQRLSGNEARLRRPRLGRALPRSRVALFLVTAATALVATGGWSGAGSALGQSPGSAHPPLSGQLVLQTAGGTTLTSVPAGATIVAATEAHGDTRRLITKVIDRQEERVLIQLRGTPLARVAARTRRAAQQALASQRQRASAAIVNIAGRLHGRTLAKRDVITREYSRVFHGLAARLPAAARAEILKLPDVQAIYPDLEVHATLSESVPLVQAPDFWSTYAYRGAGTVIAVVDTGVDYTHPDLGGCFGTGCKVIGGFDFVNDDADPLDDNGHGTHVASIAAGNGTFLGVAPDASIRAYKVLDSSGNGSSSNVIAGIERATDPNNDGDTSDHADVINLSLGGVGDPDDPLSQAVDNATAAGVLVSAAAGNSGGFFTIDSPGAARSAITVGATDKSDQIASFSSGGPTAATYELKPEIVAPGVGICAARATGTELGSTCTDESHVALSGTSMATPHVAGAAALLRGRFPSLSPAEIKALLVENSVDLGLPALVQGAGRLAVLAAAQATTVVTPAVVSFGEDDLTLGTWDASRSLTVRNLDAASHTYTLTASVPRPGITATLTPPSFTLAPGESLGVALDLTVDNTTVPIVTDPPNAYDGRIVIDSGAQQQRVPFVFIDSARLRLHFDIVPVFEVVHDRNGREQWWPGRGTTSEHLVPPGIYDAMVEFQVQTGETKIVIREGIVVNTFTEATISQSEAVYRVQFDARDEVDQPLEPTNGVLFVRHRTTDVGWSSFSVGGFPKAFFASPFSDSYAINAGIEAMPGQSRYFITGETIIGLSSNVELGNSAADLAQAEVRYIGEHK